MESLGYQSEYLLRKIEWFFTSYSTIGNREKFMSEHTPTPWIPGEYNDLKGSNGELVTVWGLGIGMGQRTPEHEANTAFIVRACNSHEALVALAERISRLNPDAGEIGEGMLHRIVSEAEAALKLANL